MILKENHPPAPTTQSSSQLLQLPKMNLYYVHVLTSGDSDSEKIFQNFQEI